MTRVEIRGLRKSYGTVEALRGLDLVVESGALVALLGPTGAGKTTTLKCIAGVEEPDDGDILFDGESVLGIPAWRRNVAMFFQSYALYPHLSVYDNIAYPLREQKMSKDEIDKMVKSVAEKLRISLLLDRKEPSTLSGGEMQRVALARTLVRKPLVFLLDEPISNLDAKLREEMRTEFKRLHKELKQTIIYATPDYLEAFAIAEKVAVIKDGMILQYDTPINLLKRPKNRFVATFIGSPTINLLKGVVRRGVRGWEFSAPGLRLELVEVGGASSKIYDGLEVEMAIRPHDIVLEAQQNANTFKAKVLAAERLGYETVVTLSVGEVELKTVSKGMRLYRYGEEVSISIPGDRVILFDVSSGEAIY
ncbi:MAG: ABC transporter ATP-binding protein [Nitrososphaerota archaeon]